MNKEKISKKLKEIREKNNNTQAEMAVLLGVTLAAVGNYEQGIRIPRDETKMKYAEIAGESVDTIFYTD